MTRREIVSSDAEPLILVDEHDNVIGHESKGRCHDGDGLLHRAFSMFVINDAGDVLLQQRSADKRLWPMYWSNSCCSHPRRGETLDVATARRLHEELGLSGDFEFLYKFQYHARFRDLGSEREMCSVYVGRCDDEPHVNETEIAAWRYIAPADLTAELATAPERFTPWFKLEWPRVLARLEKGL
ncbi:MAG: isopentenyl-diphosphate Delta-isomerase [Pseudomonadota bacterium]